MIKIDGFDITDRLMPYLISVRIIHRPLLTAEIEIDDRDARLPIPPVKAPMWKSVGLGQRAQRAVVQRQGRGKSNTATRARAGGT